MKLKLARQKLHEMRSSLGVVNNFVEQMNPSDKDEIELKAVAVISIKKLHAALEDLNDLIEAEIKDQDYKH